MDMMERQRIISSCRNYAILNRMISEICPSSSSVDSTSQDWFSSLNESVIQSESWKQTDPIE